MCIISFNHRFIFVHVPKCGGSSVSLDLSVLSRFPDLELGGTPFGEAVDEAYRAKYAIRKHSTAAEIKDVVGDELWQNSWTFATVRNPFHRTVSTYLYLRHWRGWPGSGAIEPLANINDFVASPLWASDGPDRMFLPQTFYTGHGTPAAIKATIRIENYAVEIERIMDRFGHDYVPVPGHRNISPTVKAPAQITLDAVSRDMIRSRYASDFAAYSYPLD